MASRTVKLCPHCRYHLGSTVDLYRITFGSPIKVCPRCQKKYIDSDCKELALYELRFFDKMPMSLDNLIRMSILFGLGLFSLGFNIGFAITLISIVAIWLIICFALYSSKKEKIEKERQKSIERLSNPEYANELHSMGIFVPEKYRK